MAKYFRIVEIDASAFERMTGDKLNCLQVTMLADDGNVYVAVDEDGQDYIDVDLEMFDAASTTDVAPVVHGRWIADGDGYHWTYNCSICAWKDGYPFNERHNFCPNCGARMDGDAE